MNSKKKKIKIYPLLFSVILLGYSLFTVLDTFVIAHDTVRLSDVTDTGASSSGIVSTVSSTALETTASGSNSSSASTSSNSSGSTESSTNDDSSATVTDSTYEADGVKITITTKVVDDTTVYIADIYLDDPSKLLSALANDTFGRNVSDTTSSIASSVGAILAINGDYYGFRDTGYCMRNGYLYRSTKTSDDEEDLVVYSDGTMAIVEEGDATAEELQNNGAVQIYSFGPALVNNGSIAVSENEEISGKSMTSNPRTAIGMVETGHYVMVVSDGRTSESAGLSLYELAEVMKDAGCTVAYNLDGGGSSTMVFNGSVVNKPTTNGNRISERAVSDIIYIAG